MKVLINTLASGDCLSGAVLVPDGPTGASGRRGRSGLPNIYPKPMGDKRPDRSVVAYGGAWIAVEVTTQAPFTRDGLELCGSAADREGFTATAEPGRLIPLNPNK